VESENKVTNRDSSIGEIPVVQHLGVKTRDSLLLRKSNGEPEETTGSGKSSCPTPICVELYFGTGALGDGSHLRYPSSTSLKAYWLTKSV
jgi:hypothetical protein